MSVSQEGADAAVMVRPDDRLLSSAVARVAGLWGLTNECVGETLGISPTSASRLKAGTYHLERGTKPFELGQYLVRLFRSLDSLVGSDDRSAISWLKAHNEDLDGRPIDLIRSVRGLGEVTSYVDDFRARV